MERYIAFDRSNNYVLRQRQGESISDFIERAKKVFDEMPQIAKIVNLQDLTR